MGGVFFPVDSTALFVLWFTVSRVRGLFTPRFSRRIDLKQQQLSEPNLRSGSIFVSRPCRKRNVWKLPKLGLISGYSEPIRKRVIEWCFDKRGSRKFWRDLKNWEAFLMGLEVSCSGDFYISKCQKCWQRFSESRNCRFFFPFLWSSGVKFFRVYGYSLNWASE